MFAACFVKLSRIENYEKYAKYEGTCNEVPQRRSVRVRQMQLKKFNEQRQNLPKIARRKSIEVIRKTSPNPKSILKSTLRSRSKSVSFDPRIVSPVQRNLFASVSTVNRLPSAGSKNQGNLSPAVSRNGSSVQRNLLGNPKTSVNTSNRLSSATSSVLIVPSKSDSDGQADLALDLSKKKVQMAKLSNVGDQDYSSKRNAAQNSFGDHSSQNDSSNDVGYYVDVTTSQNVTSNSNTAEKTNALNFDEEAAYETRIKNLVDSNRAKINRILELQADRNGLMVQNESLDRVNRILVKAVDDINAKKNVPESDNDNVAQIRRLENEIGALNGRIHALNRDNSGLRSENERYKNCLESFGRQVRFEHNYTK